MFTAEKPVKGSPSLVEKKTRTPEDMTGTPAEKNPRVPENTRDWLTRNEAVDMLSCALQTLVNYERKGALKPEYAYRPDGRGVEHRVLVYNPHELKKLAVRMNRPGVLSPRDAGETTARAFALIEEGYSGREIIRELRLTVEEVRELREKWHDEGGAALIISPTAKEALEKIVGAFKDVTELVERTNGAGLFIAPSAKETLVQIVGTFESVDELIGRIVQRNKRV
jgi:hypothetical protein